MSTLNETTARRLVREAADIGLVPAGDIDSVLRRGRRRRRTRRSAQGLAAALGVVLVAAAVFVLPKDAGDEAPVAAGDKDNTKSTEAVPEGEWVGTSLGSVLPEGPVSHNGQMVTLKSDLDARTTTVSASQNGIEWEPVTTFPGLPSQLMADGNGFLAAVSEPGKVTLWSSTDGQNWSVDETFLTEHSIVRLASGPTGRLLVVQVDDATERAWMSDGSGEEWRSVPFDLSARSLANAAEVGNVDPSQPHVAALVGNRHGFLAVVNTSGTNQVAQLWTSVDGHDWRPEELPVDDRGDLYGSAVQPAVASQDEIFFVARSSLWRAGPDLTFSRVELPDVGSITDIASSEAGVAVLVSRLAPLVLLTEELEITLGGEMVIKNRATDRILHQGGAGEYRTETTSGLRVFNAAGEVIVELTEEEASAALKRAGGPPPAATTAAALLSSGDSFRELALPSDGGGTAMLLHLVEGVLYLEAADTTYAQRVP